MANENKDVIRVEDTEANLPTTLIAGQLGFTTDTNKLGHLMLDGITMQWYTSTDDSWIYWTPAGLGGVTTNSPDGKFHIWNGSAGSVTADTDANELILENSGNCGMSLLSPDADDTMIAFGSASEEKGATIAWNHTSGELAISALTTSSDVGIYANEDVSIYTNTNVLAVTIDDDQDVTFGGHTYHDTQYKGSYYGPSNEGFIVHDDDMLFYSQITGSGDFKFMDGNVGIGSGTPAEKLDVQGNAIIAGHTYHNADNEKGYWGAGNDCSITYDGTDMVFDCQEVGSGRFEFLNGLIHNDRWTGSRQIMTNNNNELATLVPSSAYTVTNGNTDRSYDADSTSVAELADVLSTLISDLQSAYLLG